MRFICEDIIRGERVVAAGRIWRAMLPSGMHCESCHGLVRVYDVEAKLMVDDGDMHYHFNADQMLALLDMHAAISCGSPMIAVNDESPL